MKPLTLVILALSLVLFASARERPLQSQIRKDTVVIGNVHDAGKTAITTTQFSFPADIIFADPDSNDHLTILLRERKGKRYRNRGYIGAFDPHSAAVRWSLPVNTFWAKAHGSVVFSTSTSNDHVYDRYTGKHLYTSSSPYAAFNDKLGLAFTLGYRLVDLYTNETLWNENVRDKRSPWEYWEWLGDTAIVVASYGIHKFNLKDGGHWSYRAKTSKEDYDRMITDAAVGALLGLAVAPVIVINISTPDRIGGFGSNILTDPATGSHYFYSLDGMLKVNSIGNYLWGQPAVEGEPSKAKLLDAGDKVVLLNSGIGFHDQQPIARGRAFIAAYKKIGGKELYKRYFRPGVVILREDLYGDSLLVQTNDSVYSFLATTGQQIASIPQQADADSSVATRRVVSGSTIRIRLQDQSMPLVGSLYPGAWLLQHGDDLLVMNAKLDTLAQLSGADLWMVELEEGGELSLVSNGNHYVVVDEGYPLAHFEAAGEPLRLGKKMAFADGDKLTVVDLENIVPN